MLWVTNPHKTVQQTWDFWTLYILTEEIPLWTNYLLAFEGSFNRVMSVFFPCEFLCALLRDLFHNIVNISTGDLLWPGCLKKGCLCWGRVNRLVFNAYLVIQLNTFLRFLGSAVVGFFGIAVCVLSDFKSNYVSKDLCGLWYTTWPIVAVIKYSRNIQSDNHFCSSVSKTDLKGSCLDTHALRSVSVEMRIGRREDTWKSVQLVLQEKLIQARKNFPASKKPQK